MREMAVARHLRLLAPDRPVSLDSRLAGAEDEPAVADRRPAGAVRTGFGEAQIDPLVAGEIGMGDDVAETTLAGDLDRRDS